MVDTTEKNDSSAPAILEIVLEATFAALVGTIDNLANHVVLDDFLTPQAWAG